VPLQEAQLNALTAHPSEAIPSPRRPENLDHAFALDAYRLLGRFDPSNGALLNPSVNSFD